MARAGPVSSGVETRACPLQQLQKTQGGWGVSVSTVRLGCNASGLGRCDSRHKFTFRYPIIFWTPRNGPVLVNAHIAVPTVAAKAHRWLSVPGSIPVLPCVHKRHRASIAWMLQARPASTPARASEASRAPRDLRFSLRLGDSPWRGARTTRLVMTSVQPRVR